MPSFSGPEWVRFAERRAPETSPLALAYRGRRVLITGAGGSIGSALARVLAGAALESLVLLDASENSLFAVRRELGCARCEAILGSINDTALLGSLFRDFRLDTVFHAAAYKHVPLLESNPFAAVLNNSLGTASLVQSLVRHRISNAVLVSTDKAVHPHSIMGVSKRIAEMIAVSYSSETCRMNALRLGNVIFSSNSVIPIFENQIAHSGPVTVTHAEVSRYFMTMQEAVDAVLAAGLLESDGNILLPELAPQTRIIDIAMFLIERSGRDVPICFTGLRPGDKLHEQLTYEFESRVDDAGELAIFRTRSYSETEIAEMTEDLKACVEDRDLGRLLRVLLSTIPEYRPSGLQMDAAGLTAQSV